MYEARFPLCVVCNKDVNFRRQALCCDKCGRWQHRLCGSGMTYKDYRCLAQGDIEIAWQCSNCSDESSHSSTKDHFRRSNRGVKLRKDPDFIYEKESLNPELITSNERVELTDLPSGWEIKPKRKCSEPNENEAMNYISPNGRIFHSKQQALEFCNLHYQEVSHKTIEYMDEIPISITSDPDENKDYFKTPLTELTDKSFQPFIRLHKLNSNSDNIRMYQPFVQLQRLSPFEILRETNREKTCAELIENSYSGKIDFAVNESVIKDDLAFKEAEIKSDKANINESKIPVNDDNNNRIAKIKKRQTKLQTEIKRHIKSNIKNLKIREEKSPMKVKAQLKKDYLKINIRIDRKSLQIHPIHNLWINGDQNKSERLNLRLGSVKIKNDDILERNISDNIEPYNNGSDRNQFNQSHKINTIAENTEADNSNGSRLIWLHISPEDLDYGFIS